MKQTVDCKCDGIGCDTVINVRPILPDMENPEPLVELEIEGSKKAYLNEQGVVDFYIKMRNALNLKPVPDEVAEHYDYE